MKLPKPHKILEIRLCPHISLSIFLPFVAVCAIICGYEKAFFIAYATALLHELAHILCAVWLKVKVSRVVLYPFGVNARISAENIKNSEKEFLIAFSGPFLNLVLFWLFSVAASSTNIDLLRYCADVNLAICAVNLVPALPLDGGRMLKSILTSKYGTVRTFNFMLRLSRILICCLALFAFFLFFASDFNFSLILISAFLFQNLSREKSAISRIALSEILDSSKKTERRAVFNAKTFCVKESSSASLILRHLSYDYFCIVHVTDKEFRITKTLTETQILDALTKKGLRVKFGEI